jgi:hypothetical protein
MRRLPAVVQRLEFHGLWFFLSLILFSAPVVLLSARPPPKQLMLAFFVPWLVSLAVLFVASRGYQASSADGDDDSQRPEP